MTASTATGRPIAASLVAVVLWASYLVGTRLVFTGTSVSPFAYVVSQMIAGGLFMVALAGRGRMPWLDLLNWWTAAYGALRAVVMRCLAKSPDDRYANVSDLEQALERCRDAHAWNSHKAAEWWRDYSQTPAPSESPTVDQFAVTTVATPAVVVG